ncbi:MAG TPA: hypothetical protein GX726_04725 [Clostridiales bacterium]|nr:hypothetical protein [Clostridiales bacterium]
MKSKLLLIIMVAVLFMNACGSDSIKDDFLNYINEGLPKFIQLEQTVTDECDSISGSNYSDDLAMYLTLQDELISLSSQLIDTAESITPKTKEVTEIHEKYITAINLRDTAFVVIVAAIDNQDYEQIAIANEKLSEARKAMREYIFALNDMADKYGVEINFDSHTNDSDINLDESDNTVNSAETKEPPQKAPIPNSLLFTFDGDSYTESKLGDFSEFLNRIFVSYDEPSYESNSMKIYGVGHEGYGYAMEVLYHLNPADDNPLETEILSFEIVSLVVSAHPNSDGDTISGKEMVEWVYERFEQ